MRKLIVFLHGLNGDAETWKTVPDLVSTTLGSGYTAECPQYSASKTSPANHERSADQVLTNLLSNHKDKDLIYLVGYSDGGLIARGICRKLLLDANKDSLTNKIAAVITVGTPLEGVRLGRAILDAVSGALPCKLTEILARPVISDGYTDAIERAKKRNVRRPLHYHFEIEADRIVAPHIEGNYTADDRSAGTIEGGHTDFISTRDRIVGLANKLVEQIRDAESLLAKAYFPKSIEPSSAQLPDRLVLLACSNRKLPGGSIDCHGRPLEFLSDGSLRQRILSKRTHVFRRLKDAMIEDAFKIGSNRIHEAPNQLLRYGPDFGGMPSKASQADYLPAYQRYAGRSYTPVQPATWQIMDQTKMTVLIMSGLYGLIDAHEFIQDYDVHLTDTDKEAGVNLTAMWIDLYTQTIAAYVERSYKDRPVKIFDLLCDEDYVASVKWHQLPLEKCSVYHLTSRSMTGKQLLPCAGTIADAVIRRPDQLEIIECDAREYNLSEFGPPPEGLSNAIVHFESRVK